MDEKANAKAMAKSPWATKPGFIGSYNQGMAAKGRTNEMVTGSMLQQALDEERGTAKRSKETTKAMQKYGFRQSK